MKKFNVYYEVDGRNGNLVIEANDGDDACCIAQCRFEWSLDYVEAKEVN